MKTYNLDSKRAEEVRKKALELSVIKGDFVKESELIKYLVDKYLKKIKIKDGRPYIED